LSCPGQLKTIFAQVLSPSFKMSLCSLSHSTYETISIISLGSLVICGVAGVALGLGIAKSGGLSAHTTIKESGEPGGAGYLSIASLGFLVSGITLAWSCAGLADARDKIISERTDKTWWNKARALYLKVPRSSFLSAPTEFLL